MRKWVSIIMVLAMLAVFSIGCAQVSKDAKIKCPKCGAVFTVEEGLEQIKKMPAP
jgi:outer membrane lipoprotein-sorting protein